MRALSDKRLRTWFYLFSALFLVLIGVAVATEKFVLLFAPAVMAVLYLAFFHLDKLLWLVMFSAPVSLNIEELGVEGLGLYLPTEPILFGILVLFVIRQFYKGEIDKRFLFHPITIAITLHLAWMFLTCLTSENPVVSWKYFLARLWFVVPMYYLGGIIFKRGNAINAFLWAFIVPLTGVIVYTLVRHAINGFSEEAGHWVMTPFFRDHTSYGAVLAMFFPVVIGFLADKKQQVTVRVVLVTIATIFLVGLIFSYTRAAWLSLVAALMVYIAMRMRIKFSLIAGVVVIGGAFLFFNWENIQMTMERNKAEHATEDFAERIESMSNITTDASNLERLNLWNSAVLMFQERPVMGWGPGAFQFNYGSFQHYDDMTIISEQSGRSVNAHSEYLGPLAEMGVLGMLFMIAIVAAIVATGIRLWYRIADQRRKVLLLTILLGIISYFVHGVLNNYMDTDKAAIPIWAFAAMIAAMDLYEAKKEEASIDA